MVSIGLKLFEYEAKEVFKSYGIPVPRGVVVSKDDNIREVLSRENLEPPVVVKAQVLVGGRGKAGGVKIARTWSDLERIAENMFTSGVKGVKPRLLLIEELVEHDTELYLSVVLDRASRRPLVLASTEGGVDIEEIAREKPEAIHRLHVDPFVGLRGYMARKLGKQLGFNGRLLTRFEALTTTLYRIFAALDAELAEINPLALTSDGFVALDAKIIIDDNALWRHSDLASEGRLELSGEYTEWELYARRRGLAFVELEGCIGIMGNGAGLTMATMDLVLMQGGKPANFLDIGGGASAERVKTALELLYKYPKAKSIFINIFGGITRGDEVAKGIVAAVSELGQQKPIVVRLSGTRAKEGKEILEKAGIVAYEDPLEAAKKAVELAGECK